MENNNFSPYRNDGKLYGFICIVMGADQPVGKAIALELAAHGAACVYACSGSGSQGVADEVSQEFPKTKVVEYPFQIADEQHTLQLVDEVLNAWGRLDVWVTSAGFLGPASIQETSPGDLRNCFESNAVAPFLALKYAPPAMAKLTSKGNYPNAAPKDQTYGSIVVVSSVASVSGGCWGPAFTMSSHAALGLVKSGVATLKGTGVRINCVSPGQIDIGLSLKNLDRKDYVSHQLPPSTLQSEETQKAIIGLERAGLPVEVARVAGFLASGFSSYVTGCNIVIDGGASTMNPLTVPL